ncbi:6-phosphogluconolactonase [Flavobacterium akiainvivens]|uniref:6-phosphogluconolactonase n=1 Tax=Flavobacterium akiainvivens TaxID=1202724 RepID=UPI0006C83C6D|nr:6-phosphogluconolactonase [Flavobacterium akiainvivens]
MSKNKAVFYKAGTDYPADAAKYIYAQLKKAEAEKQGTISVALSGGSTPLPVLNLLKESGLDWGRYAFYMVDERCVPVNDPQNNYGNISQVFLEKIPSASFAMYNDELGAQASAEAYEQLLVENLPVVSGFPQFDYIFLGLGDDGHTASLFPETDALLESNKYVVANVVPSLNTVRITLTYPVLLNAANIAVLTKGNNKHKVINELYSDNPTAYPMLKIAQEYEGLVWITD